MHGEPRYKSAQQKLNSSKIIGIIKIFLHQIQLKKFLHRHGGILTLKTTNMKKFLLTILQTTHHFCSLGKLLQSNIEDLLHSFNIIKIKPSDKIAVNFFYILLILPAENNFF